ncbi:ASO-like protein, partial [Mya arenaria]
AGVFTFAKTISNRLYLLRKVLLHLYNISRVVVPGIMATQGSLLLALFVLLGTCFKADCHSHAGDCTMDMDECVFHLDVEHRLTMMDQRTLTFPSNGKLFAYDVVNTSDASPIPADNVITGDGWETPKLITAVNGKFPGPDIIVYEGQKVVVFVKNRLTSQAVTIHWHGLHQEGTPWMDGVPYVTQCPIHPGQTFKYEFYAKPKGTFWWHSHMGTQRTMGVFGAFIIKERLEFDVEDKIMQIQDWNHDHDSDTGHMKMLFGAYQGRQKWAGYKSLDDTFFSIFEIQSGLINGRGRFYEENNVDHNGAPLTVYDVQPGKVYRFRVIATGALYPFRVSVDNHNLTVIASDGYDLEPVVTESFIINPGERFDFKIIADQTVGNYWIRGISIVQGRYHRADAILRYNGAGDEDPRTSRKVCSQTSRCTVVNCPFTQYPEMYTDCMTFDQLRSAVSNDPAPPYIVGKFQEYFLNFAFPGIKTFPGSVNGRSFATPDVNPLVQPQEWSSPCTEPKCGPDNHCRCTHALSISNGDTVQMIFMNMGVGRGWAHPIHMHGHSFYVLKIGDAQYNDTTGAFVEQNSDVDCRGNLYTRPDKSFCNDATWSNPDWLNGEVPGLNLDRAPRKDTIIVPSGGYVVIRIKADNPGLWNMHCHIELHNIDGMQMVLNESFSEVRMYKQAYSVLYDNVDMHTQPSSAV